MNPHPYILEPYKPGGKNRFTCPACNKPKRFTRYIDTHTGEHLHPDVGRCDRQDQCGHHYTPKEYLREHPGYGQGHRNKVQPTPRQVQPQPTPKPSFIAPEIHRASMGRYESNHFAQWLHGLFGREITTHLLNRYNVGTSKHWPGATVFWQIDNQGNIRTGKVMQYNPTTGRRVKEPQARITWAQTVMKLEGFELRQCLFGEHLLRREQEKPVAVVESEKTAIVASVYFPKFTWLACGGLQNLNGETCKILAGRKVILFPDLGAFNKWTEKARQLSMIGKFIVSDYLERNAPTAERMKGNDLADYLVKTDFETRLALAGGSYRLLCD